MIAVYCSYYEWRLRCSYEIFLKVWKQDKHNFCYTVLYFSCLREILHNLTVRYYISETCDN